MVGLAMLSSTSLVAAALLDPSTLVQNKALQPTALRAYLPPSQNGGLETATLALG